MVIDYQHVKPGKGGAFMRTKMRNLLTGSTYEETFRTEEKFDTPDLKYRQLQFLYSDEDGAHFMDQESFEQITFNMNEVKTIQNFLKNEAIYTALYFGEKVIELTPPIFMELLITDSPIGVRGDTAQGSATKEATLETGMILQVPLFVNEGETIKIDTRDGKYIERVKK